jgi:hypothetical protein
VLTNPGLLNTTLVFGFLSQNRNPRTLPIESFGHESRRTFVRAEYGYPKVFRPTVKEEVRLYSSQYSTRLSAHTKELLVNSWSIQPKRKQAIPSVPIVFIVLVFKV